MLLLHCQVCQCVCIYILVHPVLIYSLYSSYFRIRLYAYELAGGYGTLEELLEIITWAQLGIHKKPVNSKIFFRSH
jgi:hypothetical protein